MSNLTTENNQQASDYIHQLKERIKELSCLYHIAEISNRPDLTLSSVLNQIIGILPPAMQYPVLSSARLLVDGVYYYSEGFEQSHKCISAEIMVNYQPRGIIEVFYQTISAYSSPVAFLREEEQLLKTVAQQIALIIERKQIEETNAKLQEQLRHADRLATLGQLVAGIAHEINEPLGTILGFSQLLQSSYEVSDAMAADIQKIVNATLHGREIVRKLMLFSRQMPPKKAEINLNRIIEEGFYLIENRCSKQGVEIVRDLDPDLPEVIADPGQMHQVIVNLAVNAMQAMPDGGLILIKTRIVDSYVELSVSDNGIGMDEDLIKKIFIPFFTTKDINQGTGLGLSVVHGIVTTHNGKIKVESELGKGSIFRVLLKVKNA
ncbi:MAG: sensor histidine kinase [Candidatus Cloacimonetes bacterium HGW-Cloacimonetes-1]|jgi:signal transduction histidine kinase|nr:MAG: sensor histidine kinase [Candidatus Cloacimonetes bacterium HGW-Cloacimonetes-1]